jgi:hypothetical protein
MGSPGYPDWLREIAGPAYDFNCTLANYYCGFGYGRINYFGPAIIRGGMATFDNGEAPYSVGIFAADNDEPEWNYNGAMGFRCVKTH